MPSLSSLCKKYKVPYDTLYMVLYRKAKAGDKTVQSWQRIREWDVPEEFVRDYYQQRKERAYRLYLKSLGPMKKPEGKLIEGRFQRELE